MKPIKFKECNQTYAKEQTQYRDLPAWTNGEVSVSYWKLTWPERLIFLFTGRLWLSQMNFGSPLQPQLPSAMKPGLGIVPHHSS